MAVRTAGELMATEYRTVSEEDAPARSDDLLVVVADGARPRWVVGPGGPWPAVQLGPDAPVADLSAAPGVLRLLNEGLLCVLVVEHDRLIGVLESSTIRGELAQALEEDGDAIGSVLDAPDWELPGTPAPPAALIRVRCAVCGAVGELAEFPPPDGLCPNGRDHRLAPGWES